MNDASLDRYAAFDRLLFDRPAPHVLRVTINNPGKMNALGKAIHHQLETVWRVVDADPDTRVAIITGAGRAFSAGGAIDEIDAGPPADRDEAFCDGFAAARDLVGGLIAMRKPLISAINGAAVGAGLAIALLADISIASRTAKLFDGHTRIGVTAGDHAALVWPMLCGLAKAKYHLMTNEPLTGEEAERCNLVSLAVDADALQDRAVAVAVGLAATAPTALRMTKYVLNHFLRQNQTIFDLSAALEMVNFGSAETAEAIRALNARDTPQFDDAARFR